MQENAVISCIPGRVATVCDATSHGLDGPPVITRALSAHPCVLVRPYDDGSVYAHGTWDKRNDIPGRQILRPH